MNLQRGQIQLRGRMRLWLTRAKTRLRYGSDAVDQLPIVFGNAIPKNGSKLLFNILRALPEIGPFVDTRLNSIKPYMLGKPTPPEWIVGQLDMLRPGDVRIGYLRATPEAIARACQPGWAFFQIVRDPRDSLISGIFYALEINPQQVLHDYYASIDGMEDRVKAAIYGVPSGKYQLANIRVIYDRYLGWLQRPELCVVRFEDLITDPPGQLSRILDHLESHGFSPQTPREAMLQTLAEGMDPGKSETFRKGKTGAWRDHFSAKNIAQFKEVTGDLLIRLGYEQDMDW